MQEIEVLMMQYRKIGVILILVGICIPIISFVFASGYYPRLGFLGSVQNMKIHLWEKTIIAPETQQGDLFDQIAPERKKELVPLKNLPDELRQKRMTVFIVLPYKYPFSLGIIFLLSGIGLFVLSKPPRSSL